MNDLILNRFTISEVLGSPAMAVALALAAGLPMVEALLAFRWLLMRILNRRPRRRFAIIAYTVHVLFAIEIACILWGSFIEPNMLTVTRVHYHNPKIKDPRATVRIVQISDVHVEHPMRVYDKIVEQVRQLDPDFVVLTGDYMTAPGANPVLLKFLKGLKAKKGKFAVYGNWDYTYDPTMEFALADIDVLDRKQRAVEAGGARFVFEGYDTVKQILAFAAPETKKDINVVLFHMPSRIDYAAKTNVDYYFCGHTHGGQVRLPFIGPVMHFPGASGRYVMGRYRVGDTEMFVSRGVGLEGKTGVRMRFMCPPEIAVFDITK